MHETLLTKTEESALAERIKQGDSAALDELLTMNLRLVHFMAKKFTFGEFDDRVQMGCEVLVKSAHKFNPARGRFSSFACVVIEREFLKHLQHLRTKKRTAKGVVSLESLQEDCGDEWMPTKDAGYDTDLLEEETRRILMEEIDKLTEQESAAMLEYYGLAKRKLPPISRQALDQIRNKAHAKLWRSMTRAGYTLRDFI